MGKQLGNIILTGYMGCGKTTVGKLIASLAGYAFADTDEMIEKQEGKSISNIFAKDGEAAFRKMETALLAKMIDEKTDRCVIATGGGMPMREENRCLLGRLGTVAYLRVKPETVYERIKDDDTRPLLQCENPPERIREMIGIRGSAYETADLIIDADGLTPKEAAEIIIRKAELR